jgi:ABC-type multidrug transport system ATPase subunit/pSer/pThr/pTyr-binding forkhead associated (FHA) protein
MAHGSRSAPPLLVRTVRNTHRLESGPEYRIGRDDRADVPVNDPRVSWDHAVLYAVGNGWVLEDRGSRNGTFLGAEKVSRLDITGPCVIHVGNPEDGPVLRIEVERVAEAPPVRPPQSAPSPQPSPSRQPSPASGWSQPDSNASVPGVDREPTSRISLQAARVLKIGRRPDNDIVLADLGVSKLHAELRMSPTGRYQIFDLGSHNGTYVNGNQVNQAELTEDDIVSIGHATFRLAGGVLQEYIDEGDVPFEALDLRVSVPDGGKQKVLLEGVSFPLAERSMMAVIGPAGAGKSTLLNALTGKKPATAGNVYYDYRDLYDNYDELKHRIGLVPQESVTHDQLTAKSALGYAAELRFPPDITEADRNERVDEVLGELEMTPHANTRIVRLSGGQKKRVNIGLELLTKPSLLFLDEPTSPLDPHLKRELFGQMKRMTENGQSVVVITHDVESKLIDQCDRLIVLAPGGRMAYFGPPAEGLRYFGKEDWADVFQSFADNPAADWAGQFRNSPEYTRYVSSRLSVSPGQQQSQSRRPEDDVKPRRRGSLTQVFTMARRYARVLSVDRGYMMFAIALPIILGLLLRIIPSTFGLGGPVGQNDGAQTLLLILVMAACLSGTANSIREIVKEREIYERERMTGLSAGAYLMSKVLVLGVISVVQALLIVIIGLAGMKMPAKGALIPGPPLIEIAIAVAALCVVSMLLGLVISTLVTKSDQTMPALVVVTMIQVVLSGGVFALSSGAEAWVSLIAPARWAMGALASTINLDAITPSSPLAPVKADALWAHTSAQWLNDIGVLIVLGLIFLSIAGFRLSKIGPRRRKAAAVDRQLASPEPAPARSVYS